MTGNRTKFALFSFLFLAIALPGYLVIHHQFQEAGKAATQSTVSSIEKSLQTLDKWESLAISSDWRLLSDIEYDRLMSDLLETGYIDKGGRFAGVKDGIFVDRWGSRYQIAVREDANGKTEWKVWSMGPDGESGTIDDLYPFGYAEPAPSKNSIPPTTP